MRDLIVKLETLKASNEWSEFIQSLRDWQVEQNAKLLEWSKSKKKVLCSLSDFLRHEISFLWILKNKLNIKDKDCKEAIIDWIQRNIDGRINVILWKTREFKQDNILEWDSYTEEDLRRTENYRIEWLYELPVSIANEERLKEQQYEATKDAEVQEQIDALASLEDAGL